MKNTKLIALYLPQYHPTKRNDEWWGKGFTEWTNVGKAKPLFPGHYQPHVPADLGYYDLRLPEVRKAQADMAREHGVYGFCYYHYWFEDGFEELERPFYEVVDSGEPDFPFCLCWANESWYSKFWNLDGTVGGKKCLAEQKYLGKVDNEKHFYKLLKAFKDSRYIKHKGKLLFVIYKPLEFIGLKEFLSQWEELAKMNGLPGFHFAAATYELRNSYNKIKDLGFETIISTDTYNEMCAHISVWDKVKLRFYRGFINRNAPSIIDYAKYYPYMANLFAEFPDVTPSILPNWDHTPRSKSGGTSVINATPANFDKHVSQICDILRRRNGENLCFLKSWNEWGEGNYVEPDLKYGFGFLNVLKKYFVSHA